MPSPGGAIYDFTRWINPALSPQAQANRAKQKAEAEAIEREESWKDFWRNIEQENIYSNRVADRAETAAGLQQRTNQANFNLQETGKTADTNRLTNQIIPAQTNQQVTVLQTDGGIRKDLLTTGGKVAGDLDTTGMLNRASYLKEVYPVIQSGIERVQKNALDAAGLAARLQIEENERNFNRLKEVYAMSQPQGIDRFMGRMGNLADTASRIAYAVNAFRG